MDKRIKLERLQRTIDFLEELTPEQFDYSTYVSRIDFVATTQIQGTICGTTCCVAGWYPTKIPEANITLAHALLESGNNLWRWAADNDRFRDHHESTIQELLHQWHGLKDKIIKFLFYGDSLHFDKKTIQLLRLVHSHSLVSFGSAVKIPGGITAYLPAVINGFKFIKECVELEML